MISSQVKAILNKYSATVKKQFGQNFLMDENIIRKICDISTIDKNTNVIEIGPGLGFLTNELMKHAHKVLCYEIDEEMVKVVEDRFPESNVIVKHQDFLKANIDEDIKNILGTDKKVVLVANLPYYITTAILLKVLEESTYIKQMTCMMQTEVAQRICGTPSTKDYNSLSVLIQYYTKSTMEIKVSPSCFYPEPNVDSAVVLIKHLDEINVKAINETFFKKFNRAIFSQRRKTLANNLKNSLNYNKKIITNVLTKLGYPLDVRAESLSITDIVKLANEFYNALN